MWGRQRLCRLPFSDMLVDVLVEDPPTLVLSGDEEGSSSEVERVLAVSADAGCASEVTSDVGAADPKPGACLAGLEDGERDAADVRG